MLLIVAATEPELPDDIRAETLTCGVGPVAAAVAVASRLARGPRPAAIIHVGIAGMRRESGLSLLDVVIGSSARYCDTTSPLVEQLVEPDARLRASVHATLGNVACVPIGTSANVGGTRGCEVEAMEGFAVLTAALHAGIAAVEVRVIANEIEEPDRERWQFEPALARVEQVVHELVEALTP